MGIASDVTKLVEANSTSSFNVEGAVGLNPIALSGKVGLDVSDMEASAVTLLVAKANDISVNLNSNTAKTAALTDLTVEFAGKLEVDAQNTSNGSTDDVVTKLTVKANGEGVYADSDENTADFLDFADADKVTSIVVTGNGDLELDLGAPQAKLTTFDAWYLPVA